MPSPLVPAVLAFDAAGTPYSPEYGDVYHSVESGPGQARHVFLGGNDLPARWAGACVFTVLETGFGFGLRGCGDPTPARLICPQRLYHRSCHAVRSTLS